MDEEKKKYWIKLEKDFLNSSQIKVIKHMQNGKDYIIFYLALMLESTNTEGHLRFSELVPYNEEMLAGVTDLNVDIVRSALKIFQSLGMIQILQDGTIFLPEVPKRIGKESESAERVRIYRERQKLLQCNNDVTKCNDNKDKDKDIYKDIYKDDKVHAFQPPTLDEIKSYCLERNNSVNPNKFFDFYESKGWMVGKNKMKDWKAAVRTWEDDKPQRVQEDIPYAN